MKYIPSFVLSAVFAVLLPTPPAAAQGDDFNDGSDEPEWTRLAPLAGFEIETTFSFPEGNSYRLQCAAQEINPQLGPPRAGSFRADASYTDFYVCVDISYDPGVDATFDNYLALPAAPGDIEVVDVRIEDGQLEIDFLSKPLRKYSVDRSPDLKDWGDEVTDNVVGALSDRTTFSVALTPGRLYFRIREQ